MVCLLGELHREGFAHSCNKVFFFFTKEGSFAPGVDNGIFGKLVIVRGTEEDIKTCDWLERTKSVYQLFSLKRVSKTSATLPGQGGGGDWIPVVTWDSPSYPPPPPLAKL